MAVGTHDLDDSFRIVVRVKPLNECSSADSNNSSVLTAIIVDVVELQECDFHFATTGASTAVVLDDIFAHLAQTLTVLFLVSSCLIRLCNYISLLAATFFAVFVH
jgi:predicted Co/Zn/Cd cation transporter (cation efflux family)